MLRSRSLWRALSLSAPASAQTTLAQARRRLVRLRHIQSGKAPRPVPAIRPDPPAAPRTATKTAVAAGKATPTSPVMVGGGAALASGAQLGRGDAFTVREIDLH